MARTAPSPKYNIISGDAYLSARTDLQRACQEESNSPHPIHILNGGSYVFRPLSFRETIAARVEDFNTPKSRSGCKRSLQNRLQLFLKNLDTCTSIAYQGGTTTFTIVPYDRDLITSFFDSDYITTPFPIDGIPLDSSKGKYREPLTEQEAIEHEGWIAALEGDRNLLQETSRILFSGIKEKLQEERGMSFGISSDVPREDLRSNLCIYNLYCGYSAGDRTTLNGDSSFLQTINFPR